MDITSKKVLLFKGLILSIFTFEVGISTKINIPIRKNREFPTPPQTINNLSSVGIIKAADTDNRVAVKRGTTKIFNRCFTSENFESRKK